MSLEFSKLAINCKHQAITFYLVAYRHSTSAYEQDQTPLTYTHSGLRYDFIIDLKVKSMMSSQAHFAVLDSTMSQLSKTKDMIPCCMKDTIDVALDLAEYDGKPELLKEMENTMLEFIMLERNLEEFKEAVNKVRQDVTTNTAECTEGSIIETLKQYTQELETEGKKTSLKDHEKYQEMQKEIWQVQNPGSAFPPSQVDADLGEDEEFVMTQAEVSVKCPITQTEMTDPVKNKYCGHSYEKAAVSSYIKSRRKVMCPVCGCGNQNPLRMTDLQDDNDLRLMIQRKNRQAGRRAGLEPLPSI